MEGFKEEQLTYAAHARCQCGAGLAYPRGLKLSNFYGSHWLCSAILLGKDQEFKQLKEGHMFEPPVVVGEDGTRHEGAYPFAFFEIKSELQPSQGGATTRPNGYMACEECGEPCYKCKCSQMPNIKLILENPNNR